MGVKYLVEEGFSYQNIDEDSLMLSRNQNQTVINNLKTFDGGYINNRTNLDFLVNWRRGEELFETISVRELMTGEIPPNTFRDKIVLIGSVAASTEDRHNISLTRWDKNRPWTYGIYVLAHITSSIISAALDGRPLIKVAPWGSGYLFLIASISSISYVIFKFSELRTQKLYLLSALLSLVLTVALSFGSLLVFRIWLVDSYCSFTLGDLVNFSRCQ